MLYIYIYIYIHLYICICPPPGIYLFTSARRRLYNNIPGDPQTLQTHRQSYMMQWAPCVWTPLEPVGSPQCNEPRAIHAIHAPVRWNWCLTLSAQARATAPTRTLPIGSRHASARLAYIYMYVYIYGHLFVYLYAYITCVSICLELSTIN